MAVWHDASTGEQFDDGLTLRPGEDGFTREVAEKHFRHQGFDYMGTPNWEPRDEPPPPSAKRATKTKAK